MGASHGDFIKYPRTPHLFGSKGTDDDKHLGEAESNDFIADDSLIVEEKLDGTNVGIHFSDDGEIVLQCRGHVITEGMHPQYDLFKQWAAVKRHSLEERLENRFIMFGEWVYARHSVFYRRLSHYFFEFDIYDKQIRAFLDLEQRLGLLEDTGIETVPIVHTGVLKQIAQGTHASIAFLTSRLQELGTMSLSEFTDTEQAWLTESFAKVCCRVNSEEGLMETVS